MRLSLLRPLLLAGLVLGGATACDDNDDPTGPGSRLVLSGRTDATGFAQQLIPREAGTSQSLPLLNCYYRFESDWWQVEQDDERGCVITVRGDGRLLAGMIGAPPNSDYQFVLSW